MWIWEEEEEEEELQEEENYTQRSNQVKNGEKKIIRQKI